MCGDWGALPALFVLLAVWQDQTKVGHEMGRVPASFLREVCHYVFLLKPLYLSRIAEKTQTGFIGRVDSDESLVTLASCDLMSSTHHVPRKHYVCNPHFSTNRAIAPNGTLTFALKIVDKYL